MKLLDEAYGVLSDPQKRREYDLRRQQSATTGITAEPGRHRRQEQVRQNGEAAAPKGQEEDARKNWAPGAEHQKTALVAGAAVVAFLVGFAALRSIHKPTDDKNALFYLDRGNALCKKK